MHTFFSNRLVQFFESAGTLLLFTTFLSAATIYVSPEGRDGWSGRFPSPTSDGTDGPVRTLHSASQKTGPGDTCVLRKGVYSETLRPGESGTAKLPITFTNYKNERAVISGADPVAGWKRHKGKIWVASVKLDLKDGNQVFADGALLTEARWPNSSSLFHPERARARSGSADTIQGADLPGDPAAWKGALLWCAGGAEWICWTAHITGYDAESRTLRFDTKQARHFYIPRKGNPYVLMGVRAALDHEGEWWYDSGHQKLYLIPPGTKSPEAMRIEVKRRLHAIDLSNRSHIQLKGLAFRAAGIRTDARSSHLTFDALTGTYVAHSFERDVSGQTGVLIHGSHHTVRNSTFAYSSGSVVDVRGASSRIVNCFIHSGNYGAKWRGTLAVRGRKHLIAYNTVRHSGRDLVNIHGLSESVIYKNDLSDAGWLTSDLGMLYGHNTDFGNTMISHNLVHDNHAPACNMGIYFDHCSHNVIVHHNIIWNITRDPVRFNNPSYHNLAYHNSCWDTGPITTFDHARRNDLFGTRYQNNILNKSIKLPGHVVVNHNIVKQAPGYSDPQKRDFTLRASSEARNTALPIQGMTEAATDGKADCGALEYGRTLWKTGHDFTSPPRERLEVKRPYIGGMNLLANACFELETLEGWEKTGAGNAQLARGNGWGAKSFGGNKETKPTGTSRRELQLGGGIDGVRQTVRNLQPETRYTLSGWLRVSGSGETACLAVENFAGTLHKAATSSTTWVRKEVGFTTGKGGPQNVTVHVKKISPGAGYIRADNLALPLTLSEGKRKGQL